MKLHKLVVAVTALAGVLGSTAAIAGDADFTIINKTGITITGIYLSPAHKANWGKERLGEGVYLEANKSRLLKFSDKASCEQDMLVQFDVKGNTDLTWEGLNLCEINKLTLKYNKAKNEVSYDSE